MAKPKAVIPTIEKKIQIPADLCTRMELELYSDLEQKIPYGAQSELINRLLREHFRALDIIRLEAQAEALAETEAAQ